MAKLIIARRFEYFLEDLEDYTVKDDLNLDLQPPSAENPANLVSSLCTDGQHRPALDVDVPCRYVPSSTEGHGHLYFDETPLSWDDYSKLLRVLAEVGILEKSYVTHSLRQRQTLLRPPHVKKKTPRKPKAWEF